MLELEEMLHIRPQLWLSELPEKGEMMNRSVEELAPMEGALINETCKTGGSLAGKFPLLSPFCGLLSGMVFPFKPPKESPAC